MQNGSIVRVACGSRPFRRWLILIMLMMSCLSPTVFGAVRPDGAGETDGNSTPKFAHQSWTTREGAPGFVQSLAQGKDGYLWVGSAEGLFRFDGVRFEPIPPPAGHRRTALAASALLAGSDGSIWVGYAGQGGVSVYRSGRLTDTGMPDPPAEVVDLAEDHEGGIWAVCGQGPYAVMRLFRGKWRPVIFGPGLEQAGVLQVMAGRDGTIWVLGEAQLLYRPPGATRFKAAPVMVDGMSYLVEDKDGQVWMTDAAQTRAIPAYGRGETRTSATTYRLSTPSAGAWFRTAIAHDGALWVATVTNGLFRIGAARDGQSPSRIDIGEADGLSSDRASTLLVDRQGSIWIGSERGIDRFRKAPIRAVSQILRNASSGYVMAVDAAGTVYLAQDRNIYMVRPGDRPVAVAGTGAAPEALCAARGGGMWIASNDELVLFRDGARQSALRLPAGSSGLSCGQDAAGHIWMVAEQPNLQVVYEYDGRRWRRHVTNPKLSDPRFILMDREQPVLILDRRNLIRFEGGRQIVWEGERIGFERPTAGSSGGRDLIIGGVTGLLRMRDGKLAKLDMDDHPWLRDMRGIVQARDGTVWLIGYRGLFRVSAADLDRGFRHPRAPLVHGVVSGDDQNIGVPQRRGGLQAVEGGDGRIWFLTREGVFVVQPRDLVPDAAPLPVAIGAIVANGQRILDPHRVSLPQNTQSLTIEFSAFDLAAPGLSRFRYRLDGVDPSWIEAGSDRQAAYTNLRPGHYRFHVVETRSDGTARRAPTVMEFDVAPAFYQTIWFRILCGLAVLMLLWLIYSIRLRQVALSARNRMEARVEERIGERERIAREIHDTLLQGFQGLMLRFQRVADRLPEGDAARVMMDDALELADDVLLEGRDRVRGLRTTTPADDFAGLIRRMLVDAAADRPAPMIDVVVQGGTRDVCGPVAEEIRQIGQEAFANTLRHAAATRFLVTISFDRAALIVAFRDDGIGIADGVIATGRPGHFGLIGMRERAAKIDARITIARPMGGGTEILVTVPAGIAFSQRPGRWQIWRRGDIGG